MLLMSTNGGAVVVAAPFVVIDDASDFVSIFFVQNLSSLIGCLLFGWIILILVISIFSALPCFPVLSQ